MWRICSQESEIESSGQRGIYPTHRFSFLANWSPVRMVMRAAFWKLCLWIADPLATAAWLCRSTSSKLGQCFPQDTEYLGQEWKPFPSCWWVALGSWAWRGGWNELHVCRRTKQRCGKDKQESLQASQVLFLKTSQGTWIVCHWFWVKPF